MPKYLSGRVKLRNQSDLSVDRYKYLALDEAEPNLGFPPVGGSSDIPVGDQYQVISVINDDSEVNRYWIPVGGGIIPGSLSIYDQGTLVGGVSSTTQLDIRGNAITAVGSNTGLANPGIAVTITVAPPGLDHQILFNNSGEFDGGSYFVYDNSTVGIASVGIGTSTPTQNLHIEGNLRLTGTIYDTDNEPGTNNNILKKNATGGIEWVRQEEVLSGAGGTVSQIQYHDDTGLVGGAPNFVWVEPPGGTGIGSVGIGSSAPSAKLEVNSASGESIRVKSASGSGNIVRVDKSASDTTPFIVDTDGQVGVNTITARDALDVYGTVAVGNTVAFYNDARTYYASLTASSTLGENVELTLPTKVGAASSVLYTTGSGQLSWISMSGIATNAFPNSDSLAEGSSNLYFTNERAQDTLGDAINSGIQTGINVTYNDTANSISFDVGNQSPYPFTTKGFSMPI